MAKAIQKTLREDPQCHNCKWPCMRRFLTGDCDAKNCRVCSDPKSDGGKGDPAVRKAASAELERLCAKGRVTADCKALIDKGKRARA